MASSATQPTLSADDRVSPTSTQPHADDLLTAEEVAALLDVTTSWVYEQTRRRRLPHLRLGRYVRYRRGALLAWMQHVETAATNTGNHRNRHL